MNSMKKFLSLILALLMTLSCFGICSFAEGENYILFMDAGDVYQVIGCNAYATGEINIPSTYNDGENGTKPVGSISSNAFKDVSRVSKITVPSSVKSVGASAFENCASLGTVIFEGDECTIGTAAFRNCYVLKVVDLPSQLKNIPIEAFANCSSLYSLTIPDSVTVIGKEAFRKCSAMRNVTIPANVESIGANAFLNCSMMEAYNVESGNKAYKSINGCLYDIKGETLIQHPNGSVLTGFTVPAGTKTISDSAFGSNTRLTEIKLPSGLENINDYAFNLCSALKNSEIPESVKYIGSQAFGGCKNLKNITIPANVEFYSGAFYNSGLESVILADGIEFIDEKAFEKCSSLKSVTIPSSVSEIRRGAFDGCSSLGEIAVPETVVSIGVNAFRDCSEVTLRVKKDSVAHQYAVKNNIRCIVEDDTSGREIVSVEIYKMPSKTVYTEGEKIVTDGMQLTVNYSDSTKAIVSSGFETDSQYADVIGTKTVTVTYKGKSATFTVTVNPATEKKVVGMRIGTLPTKTNYFYKETLNTSGMKLNVEYDDGSVGTVTSGYSVPATTFRTVGTHMITVTYEGFEAEFSVNVTYAWWQMLIRILLLGFLWY